VTEEVCLLGAREEKEKAGFPHRTVIQTSLLNQTAEEAGQNCFFKLDLDALHCGFKQQGRHHLVCLQ